ncbi:MAG: hypothetical protein JW837_08120 [Sedimentisphaerales bacterium]|nr:hypothetical protein [Sedimentisphaerales bacterium]
MVNRQDLVSDEALIEAIRKGDSNAAACLYDRYIDPEQLQKHIQKFLGDNIQTVGYWFGNSSIPGRIEALIGLWKLNLSFDTEMASRASIRASR